MPLDKGHEAGLGIACAKAGALRERRGQRLRDHREHPATVVAANTADVQPAGDLLPQALSPVIAERVIGESYGCAGIWAIGGWGAGRGRHFVHLESLGGGMGASGAGPGLDGHRVLDGSGDSRFAASR